MKKTTGIKTYQGRYSKWGRILILDFEMVVFSRIKLAHSQCGIWNADWGIDRKQVIELLGY
jgi:hypothetical protein